MMGIRSLFHLIQQSAAERCAATLQAQSNQPIRPSTTDRQASFGAAILACIHGLPGQQTTFRDRSLDLDPLTKAS